MLASYLVIALELFLPHRAHQPGRLSYPAGRGLPCFSGMPPGHPAPWCRADWLEAQCPCCPSQTHGAWVWPSVCRETWPARSPLGALLPQPPNKKPGPALDLSQRCVEEAITQACSSPQKHTSATGKLPRGPDQQRAQAWPSRQPFSSKEAVDVNLFLWEPWPQTGVNRKQPQRGRLSISLAPHLRIGEITLRLWFIIWYGANKRTPSSNGEVTDVAVRFLTSQPPSWLHIQLPSLAPG